MNFELAKRTKRHPLSPAQIEALRVMSDCKIKISSSASRGDFVRGTVAAALERRGLVKSVGHTTLEGKPMYQITTAGVVEYDRRRRK